MKQYFPAVHVRHLVILLAFVLFAAEGRSQVASSGEGSPLSAPTGAVNDYAGVIDPAAKQALEDKIRSFKESSNPSVELAVAVVRTTGERDIFDYSLAVARGWGIGSKEDDNPGALLFVAIDDRKYFTQISKDLEDELPDGLAGSLQRQFLVPEFRKGNYAKGISDTIDAYIRTIESRRSGEAQPSPAAGTETRDDEGQLSFNFICCLIIGGILLLIIFSAGKKNKNDRDRWGGGGGFGGGGGALPWIIGSIIANSGSSSGSSSWGGGGSSSWGGGGGGWGGFGGGGDFGGGGAGGGW